jgi:hypothetical protein
VLTISWVAVFSKKRVISGRGGSEGKQISPDTEPSCTTGTGVSLAVDTVAATGAFAVMVAATDVAMLSTSPPVGRLQDEMIPKAETHNPISNILRIYGSRFDPAPAG